MPTGEQFGTNVPQTNTTAPLAPGVILVPVLSSSNWPSTPFTAWLGLGTSLQEEIYVTGVSGTNWTVTRGYDGTVQQQHPSGQTVTHGTAGHHFTEPRSHIDASTSPDASGKVVHGLGGGSSVVGTTDAQSLSNKTLVAPTVSGAATFSGTLNGQTLPSTTDTIVSRNTTDTLTNKTIAAATYTGNQTMGSGTWTSTGFIFSMAVGATGRTGATTNGIQLAGGSSSGAPSSGSFSTGDLVWDSTYKTLWLCTGSGSPGTWVPVTGKFRVGGTTVSGTAASMSVTIPSGFTNLEADWVGRSDNAATNVSCILQLNGDSGNNYLWQQVETNNASVAGSASGALTGGIHIGKMPAATATASYFGNGNFVVNNASAAVFKTAVGNSASFTGTANSFIGTYGGQWNNTAALTSLTILPGAGNFITGSEMSVWATL